METTNQKPKTDTQTRDKKNVTKENHQITREETKRRKEQRIANNQIISNKMATTT